MEHDHVCSLLAAIIPSPQPIRDPWQPDTDPLSLVPTIEGPKAPLDRVSLGLLSSFAADMGCMSQLVCPVAAHMRLAQAQNPHG